MKHTQLGSKIPDLRQRFFKVVSEKNYSEQYQNYFRIRFNSLETYMNERGVKYYTPAIGSDFLEEFLRSRSDSHSIEAALRTFISKVNDVYDGSDFIARHKTTKEVEPVGFQVVLDDYSSFCLENGNKSSTIDLKHRNCRAFCLLLNTLGCYSPLQLSDSVVIQSCLATTSKGAWRFIREFLSYLHSTAQCNKDFSYLVPKARKKEPIPSVYSIEEIKQTEDTVDTSTRTGKRDICILLLESRLAMRSGDIVKMTFDEIDFDNNRIAFYQEKTDVPMNMPMIPEIKTALEDYIKNARPDSEDNHIFLRVNAPFLPLTTASLRNINKKYMKMAGINLNGRRGGPHTRRSSTASSMVNDGISYEVVKKILGHTDPNAIKHYAALDKENLRKCAIPVPPLTGKLKDLLEGGSSL